MVVLVTLVNEIGALINEQLKKLVNLVMEQMSVWAREDIGMFSNCVNCIDL